LDPLAAALGPLQGDARERLRRGEVAAQRLGVRLIAEEREAERAIARPAVVADEPAAGGQERGRGGVGGRAPGPSAGLEVESGDRVALLGIVDERGAEVQVADALEDRL